MTSSLPDLKRNLLTLLDRHAGDTTHPEVTAALETLTAQCPIEYSARQADRLVGDWKLVSASMFPGGERLADGRYAFTLGRLSFNAFEPLDLRLVIDRISQPVAPIDNGDRYRCDAVVEFTILDERGLGLRGVVRNLAVWRVLDDTTLGMEFTGGTLDPPIDGHTEEERSRWLSLFTNPTAKQAVRPNLSQRLNNFMTSLFLKLAFGVQPASPMNEAGIQAFEIRRSPLGKLAVRYLDEDLRIIYGDKTLMIATRVPGLAN